MGNSDVERRLVLATAAGLVASGAQALQPAGMQLDFTRIGGSPRNAGPRNRQLLAQAVSRIHAAGGGTLIIPAGTYPFSGDAVLIASNVAVLAEGATFRGPDCRITISDGSTALSIHGLTLVDTSGSSAAYLLNCAGSQCRFLNVHLEKSPATRGYIAYCRQNTVGNRFENFSFRGSNGVFMGGRDHQVLGGWAEASGGDDCWVLKATVQPCSNIRISGFRARGFAALISIGSEVGNNRLVRASGHLFVRGVTVENCAADQCTYLAYIKPGGIKGGPAYDYRDGLVEDIRLIDCRAEDPNGLKFRNAVYVSPGRGATVRRLTISNLTVRARGRAPAVQTTGAIYLRTLQIREEDAGSTIEDVVVTGLRCVDPFGGAPTGPGVPVQIPIAIEKQVAATGRIGRIEVADALVDGCSRSAVQVGPQVAGPVLLRDSQFLNYAAGVLASADRQPILASSPVTVQNIVAIPSPLAPAGTGELRIGAVETVL